MSDSGFQQFVAGMADSRGVLAPFCGLLEGPIFWRILYHKPAGKYRGKAKYKNTRTQEPRNSGMGKIEIRNKFENLKEKWGNQE